MSNRSAPCHPDKKYFALNQCRNCYQKNKMLTDVEYRASQVAGRRRYYTRNKSRLNAASRKFYHEFVRPLRLRKHGKCSICQKDAVLCYDHDHKTGRFRGWICRVCNSLLGFSGDSPATLMNAVKYLKEA